MAEIPDYDNANERDDAFVSTGFVLIEEGLDAEGEHAFRFRYTVSKPMALGLMQLITDKLRLNEVQSWGEFADGEADEE